MENDHNNHKEILIDLEELSGLLKDSINGFQQSAERFDDEHLKKYLNKCSIESTGLWKEINEEITKLQGEIKTKGTLKGAINHLWMKLKADMELSDHAGLLKNIELCENFNINRYEHILKISLPPNIESLLKRHHSKLTSRLEEIRIMRQGLETNGHIHN